MQFLLDNAVAMIVGGTIVAILAGITLRNNDAVIAAHNMEAMREQQLSFLETLRRDLQNAYDVGSTYDGAGSGTGFTFHARIVDEQDNVLDRRITYVNQLVGSRDGVPLYRVQRWEGSPSPGTTGVQAGDVAAGRSMPTLTAWTIRARNEEGQNVADPANTKQIYVFFESLPPVTHGETAVDRTQFETTFRPVLLQTDEAAPVL